MKRSFFIYICFNSVFFVISAASSAADIQHKQTLLKKEQQMQARYNSELKVLEKKIGEIARVKHEIDSKLQNLESDYQLINIEVNSLKRSLETKRQELLNDIERRYKIQDQDFSFLKALLSESDPYKVETQFAYQKYINQAFLAKIDETKALEKSLLSAENSSQQMKTGLERLKQDTLQQEKTLRAEQEKKIKLQANSKLQITAFERDIQALRNQEKALIASIASQKKSNQSKREIKQQEKNNSNVQTQSLMNTTNINNPKLNLKGNIYTNRKKLDWPLKGKVVANFNDKRVSDLRWKGMLISARDGTQVRSVFPGKVIYADWLKGYGLMVVIEHSDGYMSLYGRNQSLLKPINSFVSAGEVIALSGNTGGGDQSGLYFEIRYNGVAKNPRNYLK